MNPDPFFRFITERYKIFLKKEAGEPRPWTEDDILDYYKFTNVFREDDATTVWFRNNVRNKFQDKVEGVLATVLFRWFNRISTGEVIFNQIGDYKATGRALTAWDFYLESGEIDSMRSAILSGIGPDGPHVTGAYIIKTPNGSTKLNGVLNCVHWFYHARQPLRYTQNGKDMKTLVGWREGGEIMLDRNCVVTLEQAWDWLRKFEYMGDFMSYEVVTDLRHTDLLNRAPDIMTWANAGPGAMRGLNRLYGRELNLRPPKKKTNQEMFELLELSKDSNNWPSEFPPLEMREVEHMLCEMDKYIRVDKGEGKPRGVYK